MCCRSRRTSTPTPAASRCRTPAPTDLVSWDQNQKIFDLREDWWAIEAGLIETPDVKRIIIANIGGQVGQTWIPSPSASSTTNSTRRSTCARSVIGNILAQNRQGHHPLGQRAALRLPGLVAQLAVGQHPARAVRRRQGPPRAQPGRSTATRSTEILYEGAKIATIYPFPLYPGLQEFADSPEVKALEEKYQPRLFDPEQSAALMTEAGFTKNGDGLWEKDGETVNGADQRL